MGMQPVDVFRLSRYFKMMDGDLNGSIDRKELLAFLKQSENGFVKRMFSMLDQDYDNIISFKEFVVGCWNYLTMSKISLPFFTFDLYDHDCSGFIELKEIMMMMRDLYGDSFETNDSGKQMLAELTNAAKDQNKTSSKVILGPKEFQNFCLKHPELVKPSSSFQELLRKKICGRKFWSRLSKRRIELPNGSNTRASTWLQQRMEPSGAGGRKTSKVEAELAANSGPISARRTSKRIVPQKIYKTPNTVRRAMGRIAESMSPPAASGRRVGRASKKKKKPSKKIDPEEEAME
jgi:Ca2+-binding EF-hand superfamily protein